VVLRNVSESGVGDCLDYASGPHIGSEYDVSGCWVVRVILYVGYGVEIHSSKPYIGALSGFNDIRGFMDLLPFLCSTVNRGELDEYTVFSSDIIYDIE